MKIELVFNTLTLNVRLRREISLVSLDAIKSKIKNIIAYNSIDVLPRKEKTCEKWNFSLVVNMTSNDISKY